MNRQKYKAEATLLEPSLQIGKSGIENVAQELKNQLKARQMIKVRFLRTALLETNKQELAEKLSNLTDSELIEIRGNTAVFRRKT